MAHLALVEHLDLAVTQVTVAFLVIAASQAIQENRVILGIAEFQVYRGIADQV